MCSLIKLLALAGVFTFILLSLQARSSEIPQGPQPPFRLRCEYLKNPLGIDVKQPRFSWALEHSQRGQVQSAFQVLVSTEPSIKTGNLWDSGKVASDQSVHVVYKGKTLESGKSYYWKVRYWDRDDVPSPYSAIAGFETGLFAAEEWEGEWITGENQLRKEFSLDAKPIRGRAYICGLGYYEFYINGQKVGCNVLDPAWTTYDKRVLYATFDITGLLKEGKNAVGILLGKGWYKSLAALLQMDVELEGGTRVSIVTDESWKTKAGPVVSDSIYDGEIYDARLETPGWDLPGFDDGLWKPCGLAIAPRGVLSAQMMPAIRVVDTLVPLQMNQPKPGVYVFDLGQNFSGWARLRVCGPRGTRVQMRFAELVYEDGLINTENLRSAKARDVYILKGGEAEEVYEPRFTYHGFRYVELTGFPGVPSLETLRGRVVHSDVEQTGSFSSSHPLLNQLQRNIIWGQKTNLHSVPTDCCQRDERMGWLGDAHLTAEEAMLNFDLAAFYANFIRDIRDVQDERGRITDTVPHVWGRRPADPAWGTAYPLLCWYLYQYYGDIRILEDHYEGLKKYAEFLRSQAVGDLLKYSYYGDWVALEKTPGSLISTFFYYYDVKILAEMANVLGNDKDAQAYLELAEKIKTAFNSHFFNPETKNYSSGTQTANTLPLSLDLPPEPERGWVFENLKADILYRHNTHLTTGIVGAKYVMEVLTKYGASDLAYELATQTTYPSWGYMLAMGATTIWELWQYKTGPSMNSHNHPMLGCVGAWFYKALAGINPGNVAVGFKKILIQPQIVRDLRFASGAIQTLRGKVACSWVRSEKSLSLEVSIPVNSEAEVMLPKFFWEPVILKENGTPVYFEGKFLTGIPGINRVEETKSSLILKLGSGRYSFDLSSR